jgi:hypothetical protein
VTVVGTTAYVLEGQLDALFGKPDPRRVSKPSHATAVEVGALLDIDDQMQTAVRSWRGLTGIESLLRKD